VSVFLKWFFNLLYHEFAWAYDLVASVVSLGSWQKWVTSALPYLTGECILELGHGPGHLQVDLLSRGKRSIALDQSRQMNRLAYRRIKDKRLQPTVINGYAQTLPFPDATFDHVTSTFPTEFIFQIQTLNEIRRVLAPESTLVVIPAAIVTGDGPLVWAIKLLYKVTDQAPDSFNQQVIERVVQPFTQAGFEVSIHINDLDNSQVLIITARPLHDTA
jgi:ubiquinone/menaquinone biosynthesis C-methylase UbiE